MEKAGKAFSLVVSEEMNMIRRIEMFMNRNIMRYYLSQKERSEDRSRYGRYPKSSPRSAQGDKSERPKPEDLEDEEYPETIADTSMY